MYSRYNNRSERPLRLPDNYGGTAFSDRPTTHEPPPPKVVEIAKPTPPPDRTSTAHGMPPPPRPVVLPPKDSAPRHEPMPLPIPVPRHEERREWDEHHEYREHHDDHDRNSDRDDEKNDRPTAAFLQPFQGLFGHMGNTFPFTHGLGFDELLLIGLIILLSRNEADSDVVLWLALLLFCG